MTGCEIRNTFLEFFQSKGHKIVPSASLIPRNDPTLLFTNAGMVPFKDTFLGLEKRSYNRAVSSQKCVRAGGKHNDLEMVGRTARHHTFFEMLGNFSFGDYFKTGAIEMGWEFLTETLNLPKEKLLITVFREDDEAYDIWHNDMNIPKTRLFRLDEKDNFWSMGDTGPCGPCSEIIFDQGKEVGCKMESCDIYCDCDRHLEIWNLVFMQYNRDKDGTMTNLPNPSIDTGMGLERLTAVMQGVSTNFQSDLILPLIKKLKKEFNKPYGENKHDDVSFNVIADHVRATAFLILDGIMPSNEGSGYVLRRIMRRALRHGKLLGKNEPFLYKIFDTLAEIMNDAYPELSEKSEYIKKVILTEEERFESTLNVGMTILDEIIEKTKKGNLSTILGSEIFKLYDTYGFPLDLAVDSAADAGLSLDIKGYEDAMEEQKKTARASWKGDLESQNNKLYIKIKETISEVEFTGYNKTKESAKLLYIIKNEEIADFANAGDEIKLIFDKSPFYAESGGQAGDSGSALSEDVKIQIKDTTKAVPGIFIHIARVLKGKVTKHDILTLQVNEDKRKRTVLNHSATHLLQSALKQVLGDHVKQAGSLVDCDRLRFDFTHFSKITRHDIDKIEEIINTEIRKNTNINTETLPIDEALKRGATALFGEKYDKTVRMVKMGDFSTELCGGTHAMATGDIGFFKIISESSIASGTRRIEALTGETAFNSVKRESEILVNIQELVKAAPGDEIEKVKKLNERIKNLIKENESLKQKMISSDSNDLFKGIKEIKGVSVLGVVLDGIDAKDLRAFVDKSKDKIKSGVVVIGTISNKKVLLAAGVTKDLLGKYHAGNILKEAAVIVGGSGGGRPDMAQAGGNKPEKLKEAVELVYEIVGR